MQSGTPRFPGGETTSSPNIRLANIWTVLSRTAASSRQRPWRRKFVLILGLPKTTARIRSISSTAEKKAARRDGVRSLTSSQAIIATYVHRVLTNIADDVRAFSGGRVPFYFSRRAYASAILVGLQPSKPTPSPLDPPPQPSLRMHAEV